MSDHPDRSELIEQDRDALPLLRADLSVSEEVGQLLGSGRTQREEALARAATANDQRGVNGAEVDEFLQGGSATAQSWDVVAGHVVDRTGDFEAPHRQQRRSREMNGDFSGDCFARFTRG